MKKEKLVEICSVCAWRATCQKKFSISGKDIRCPDFVRDLSIKTEETGDEEGKKEAQKK
ncbi:hypothetical protein MNBD_NITROSPIRAE02-1739 [hydrothermal vent metagenome]|uniref:Uncharacterized protein n=1 Tax=hydrothermal vent metagenome TaxID=652676 RepID=A0A3B1CIT1_9ZZZZ